MAYPNKADGELLDRLMMRIVDEADLLPATLHAILSRDPALQDLRTEVLKRMNPDAEPETEEATLNDLAPGDGFFYPDEFGNQIRYMKLHSYSTGITTPGVCMKGLNKGVTRHFPSEVSVRRILVV